MTLTPKEHAKELFDSYWYCLLQSNIEKRNYWSQQCALIAVDDMLKELEQLFEEDEPTSDNVWYLYKHYEKVKQEIELL